VRPASLARPALVGGVAVLALVGATIGVSAVERGPDDPPPLAAAIDPLLPNLVMAPVSDITAAIGPTGARRLRFPAMVVNLGTGAFLLRADRPIPFSDAWTVVQLVTERGGGHTERATPATLVYGGDGHDHFHIREVERHRLETMTGTVLGEVVKQGFCFFDTDEMRPDLAGAPTSAVHTAAACGGRLAVRSRMGLSVGWGDEYPWDLLQQDIDISVVPDGEYRVRETADPFDEFLESDEHDNETWTDIRLTTVDGAPSVTVLRQAPGTRPSAAPG
jgi:hypothetical protein